MVAFVHDIDAVWNQDVFSPDKRTDDTAIRNLRIRKRYTIECRIPANLKLHHLDPAISECFHTDRRWY